MAVIKFRYTKKRSWNCDRLCETKEELIQWLEHETNAGNTVKKVNGTEYIVTINY